MLPHVVWATWAQIFGFGSSSSWRLVSTHFCAPRTTKQPSATEPSTANEHMVKVEVGWLLAIAFPIGISMPQTRDTKVQAQVVEQTDRNAAGYETKDTPWGHYLKGSTTDHPTSTRHPVRTFFLIIYSIETNPTTKYPP
jgi:hypothetical protein